MANLLKVFGLMAAIAVTTGCSTTMSSSFDSFKYGKLYAMSDAINEAIATQCEDSSVRTNVLNWVVIGYNDLSESRKYMEKGTDEYARVKNLMDYLSVVGSRRTQNHDVLCQRIEQVAEATQLFLSELNTEKSVILASNSY